MTDVGRQRRHNEDNVLVKPELGLYVVADGMGGHNAGDVASKLTTTSLQNFFEATKTGSEIPSELIESSGPADVDARRIVAAVKKANRDVFTISSTHSQHHGMGSTVVALHIGEPGKVHVAHVGDSRCYRVRDGKIEQLTRDHSLINDAIDLKPDLTDEELARLPKNIITRALGMKDQVKVDIRTEETRPGDLFLLCSDGLSGMISDRQMLEVLSVTDDPAEACELLIAEANDAGGNDNISALLVRIAEDSSEPVLEVTQAKDGAADVEEADLEGEEPAPEPTRPRERGVDSPMVEPLPDAALPEDVVHRLAKGEEVELDVRGAWSERPAIIARCDKCRAELLPGNAFCVECGARVST